MNKKALLIGGGVLLVIIVLVAMRNNSSSATTTATVTPSTTSAAATPDTSGVQTAQVQGQYGLAQALINAGGTIDAINAQNAGAVATAGANTQAISAGYAGQAQVVGAEGMATGYVDEIQGVIANALATIQAKNNVDLATIDSNTQLGLGQQGVEEVGIQTQGATNIAAINANSANTIAGINATAQEQANTLAYQAHLNDNSTAVTINEKTQEQQTKRTGWSAVGGALGAGLGALAVFGL